MIGLLCGQPHHRYPETLCAEPAGHYVRDRDPHAGPLIIDGRERGGAAWDEPKDTMPDRHTVDSITSDALDALYEQLEAAEKSESQRQLATAREALASATTRAARAEAAIARVRGLAERWQTAMRDGERNPAATAVLAALDDPACTCTYGERCPNCRD